MLYRVIGVMSGSSLDGLDLAYVELQEQQGKWAYEIRVTDCLPYPPEWKERLAGATGLSARDYLLLHSEYGHYIGNVLRSFMASHGLQYQVALVASHGHTSFHLPPRMTAQLGDGAAIAAETGLPVITDLRAMDVALGGQGAPIVPMGERLLWKDVDFFLNIGGIANISVNLPGTWLAYDVCPANRVLNLLSLEEGKDFDEGGAMAANGILHPDVLRELNSQSYYRQSYPKSLANDFGTDIMLPMLKTAGLGVRDALRTYSEHIAVQVTGAVEQHLEALNKPSARMMVTGGGAFNTFLVDLLRKHLEPLRVEVEVPEHALVSYKEALVMALLGVLRWREEKTTLRSVTGAKHDSIGGAVWYGIE